MRAVVVALAAGMFAGCMSDSASDDLSCPKTNTWARVDVVEGTDLEVVRIDFSRAVLHTQDADIHQLVGGTECYEAFRSGVVQGKEIQVDVDAWAESYPPQAWPKHIVILG